MTYTTAKDLLRSKPRRWLVTGAAGFIGSHILEQLLALGQKVTGLDNFATGSRRNLEEVRSRVTEEDWKRFSLIEGDVREPEDCRKACGEADLILHEAAFVSVPLSMEDPAGCNRTNVDGFLNILIAAKESGVQRVVYASSSAVYGDLSNLPQVESKIGAPLSPYGASKLIDEIYASAFRNSFGIETVGLRYFNIFGPRQDPSGGYAAVIPAWISALVAGRPCRINGDGTITRDFCHVENVVQANLLAAIGPNPALPGSVYNVAAGARTTLNELFRLIAAALAKSHPEAAKAQPVYEPERPGDILHSGANTSKIEAELGYRCSKDLPVGLEETVAWYASR